MSERGLRSATAEPARWYRCSTAARWLPRVIGASLLIATMLGAFRVEARKYTPLPYFQRLVVLAGALVALAVVRRGAELRRSFGLAGDELVVAVGARRSRLSLAEIERLYFAAPFAGTTSWIAATVLVDRDGRQWRLPALIRDGGELVTACLARAGRNDLEAWADAYRVVAKMGRASLHVWVGYATAAALLAVSVAYYFA
ncbi:MAG TPA: hypothetical protein VD788_12575 [Candidatus Polarisedimenticolaceae bacterium]|nr:hypothetical protein [Candidatus Polarisedimenticolaceae bacterium]